MRDDVCKTACSSFFFYFTDTNTCPRVLLRNRNLAFVLAGGGAETEVVKEVFADTASVEFLELSEVDIECYVSSGEPMDKAGSYGIQGVGGNFVRKIDGDFFNVMGLPMSRVSMSLAKIACDASEKANT